MVGPLLSLKVLPSPETTELNPGSIEDQEMPISQFQSFSVPQETSFPGIGNRYHRRHFSIDATREDRVKTDRETNFVDLLV